MEYSSNGLGRGIRDTIRMVGVLVMGGWEEKYKQPKFIENAEQERIYYDLLNLIDAGKLNEAENKLIEQLDELQGSTAKEFQYNILGMALCIYGYMNEKGDDFLEDHGFPRTEIQDGVDMVMQRFGLHS